MNKLALSLLLAVTVIAVGCSPKPPRNIIGLWKSDRDMGLVTVSERLELKADGQYSLSRVSGGGPTFTGGPVTGAVEPLHSGSFTVKGDTLQLKADTVTVGGLERNAPSDMTARTTFRLQGKTLTLNDGAALMIEKVPAPGETSGAGRPAAGLSGPVTLTRS